MEYSWNIFNMPETITVKLTLCLNSTEFYLYINYIAYCMHIFVLLLCLVLIFIAVVLSFIRYICSTRLYCLTLLTSFFLRFLSLLASCSTFFSYSLTLSLSFSLFLSLPTLPLPLSCSLLLCIFICNFATFKLQCKLVAAL